MASMTRRSVITRAGVISLLWVGLSLTPALTWAQSLWLDRDHPTTILVEAVHVDVDQTDERFLSGVAFLDIRHEIIPGTAIVGELAYTRFARSREEFLVTPTSESSIGNPYVGVEDSGNQSPFFGEFGVRIPLMKEKVGAEFTGLFSDLPRSWAFIPNTVPIQAALNLRTPRTSEIRARLRFGPTFTIPTKSGLDSDLYGVYAWEMGYEGRSVRVGSALSGWVLFTGDFGNLGSRTVTQFEFHADFGAGKIRPGAVVRVPSGVASDYASSVVGLSLAYLP
jgi:hypothetical protein